MRYVVVEHLEPCISPWLLSEYSYLSKLFKMRTVFTNVKDRGQAELLRKYGTVFMEDFLSTLPKLGVINAIILDPKASKPLRREELVNADAVIVGGIMGDHPPRGRTEELITSRARHLTARNLGEKQLTIAGVAYVLKEIEDGRELGELDIRYGLQISVKIKDFELVVDLPYAFPYRDGKPVLPEDYVEVITKKSLTFEDNPCIG
ncbi:MAG: SAM-dependent methyltransferase [Sulfolobales archaeon]